MDRDHPVQFLDGRTRDGMGKILSRRFPYFPVQSHFSHPKADISPNSKLKGRSRGVVGRKIQYPVPFCPVLSHRAREAVQNAPRRSTESVETKEHSAMSVIQQWYGDVMRLGKRQLSSIMQIRWPCAPDQHDCKVAAIAGHSEQSEEGRQLRRDFSLRSG